MQDSYFRAGHRAYILASHQSFSPLDSTAVFTGCESKSASVFWRTAVLTAQLRLTLLTVSTGWLTEGRTIFAHRPQQHYKGAFILRANTHVSAPLRCPCERLLTAPLVRPPTFDDRAFPFAASRAWNSQPSAIGAAMSLVT